MKEETTTVSILPERTFARGKWTVLDSTKAFALEKWAGGDFAKAFVQ